MYTTYCSDKQNGTYVTNESTCICLSDENLIWKCRDASKWTDTYCSICDLETNVCRMTDDAPKYPCRCYKHLCIGLDYHLVSFTFSLIHKVFSPYPSFSKLLRIEYQTWCLSNSLSFNSHSKLTNKKSFWKVEITHNFPAH